LGIHSALLYLFVYFLLILNLLSFIFLFRIPGKGLLLRTLSDLRFIFHGHPYLGLSLTFTLFSLAGLPPLAGFFGKIFVLISFIESESYIFPFLLLLISAISSFFYLDFIVRLLFQYDFAYIPTLPIPAFNLGIIYITSLINLAFLLALPYINWWILFAISDLNNTWFW
jgi:NADH-quinone oxidoreductase subunit N